MGHASIWSPQYWQTPCPHGKTMFLMRSKHTGHMVCSLMSWSCCCNFCISKRSTFCSWSVGLTVEVAGALLVAAALLALLGALKFELVIKLLLCKLLFKLLYVDCAVEDEDGVAATLNLLLIELQLFMLILCPLWFVPCRICASFLCSSTLCETFAIVPVDPQQTLNGIICSMAVRHWTHFFIIGAQWSQATMCPQGLKKIEALRSEQTRHSSIWKVKWLRSAVRGNYKTFYLFSRWDSFATNQTFFDSRTTRFARRYVAARLKDGVAFLFRA